MEDRQPDAAEEGKQAGAAVEDRLADAVVEEARRSRKSSGQRLRLNSASVASTAVAALATAIGGRRELGRPPAVHLVLAIRVELAPVLVSSVR